MLRAEMSRAIRLHNPDNMQHLSDRAISTWFSQEREFWRKMGYSENQEKPRGRQMQAGEGVMKVASYQQYVFLQICANVASSVLLMHRLFVNP